MKIAFFTDTYLPTINGVSYALHNWRQELSARGHEVVVVSPSPKSADHVVPFRSVPFPFYEGYRVPVVPPFRYDFSDVDIVHLNSFFVAGLYGLWQAWRHDIPVVSHVHTSIEDFVGHVSERRPLKRLLAGGYVRWERAILDRSEVIITPTEGWKAAIADRVDNTVHVMSNGVDTNFFQPVDPAVFRERYGITGDKVIGYTGRLSKEKRLEELFAVAAEFDGEIVIGGDGPDRSRYEELTADLDNVIFLGFMDRAELPAFYSMLDIQVCPSRVETEGLIVLEGNACGTPAVGADARGLSSTIVSGTNGYTYEPGNTADLAAKIRRAYDELESLQQGARQHADERSLHQIGDRLVSFYRMAEKAHA